jgi:hypothetical protein
LVNYALKDFPKLLRYNKRKILIKYKTVGLRYPLLIILN